MITRKLAYAVKSLISYQPGSISRSSCVLQGHKQQPAAVGEPFCKGLKPTALNRLKSYVGTLGGCVRPSV
jgi:hypothetical protein